MRLLTAGLQVRVLLAELSTPPTLPFFLYILKSESANRFYVGSSEDPKRRLSYHNSIEKGFTARYRPWALVYTKEFETKHEALAAERKVKAWKSAKMIERLVSGKHML